MPTDMAWLREWDNFLHGDAPELAKNTSLLKPINDRLTWEIVNQFGHRAGVGPSLERSGVCGVFFDPERCDRAGRHLQLWLSNEVEGLRAVTQPQVSQFLLGMLHHLRLRGGILQPATDGEYIKQGGKTFLWKRWISMPPIGPSTPRPVFWVNASANRKLNPRTDQQDFEPVLLINGKSWCQDWLRRNFKGLSLLFSDQTVEIDLTLDQQIDILIQTLDILTAEKILDTRSCGGGRAWGIPLDAIAIHNEGTVLVCDRCHHQITAHACELPTLAGMACLNRGCEGHYHPDQRSELSYYRRLYRQGEVQRIIAQEHTGLLAREDRERLEQRFIERDRPGAPNLLSATSTLEMGINIGDLSTVFLSAVPPTPANFQQRIGRAGRRDGNAFVNVIASGQFHDLYFYTQPSKMINGSIEAAGCYLDAVAILQRQLTAFCLDCWIASGVTQGEFPLKVQDVLRAIAKPNPKQFPHNWLAFITQHRTTLIEDFLALFPIDAQTTTARTHTALRQFMAADDQDQVEADQTLAGQMLAAWQRLHQECDRLRRQIRQMSNKVKKLEAEPDALQDPERIAQINAEVMGFRQLLKSIDNKQTLNFLTDEGLLPNYAFPEAGVTLQSILWRKNNQESTKNPKGKAYETLPPLIYERPAQVAIRELVPNGVFYAQGRKVTIDQIDLKLSKPEQWRLCPQCNYTVQLIEAAAHEACCPRCGDGMWSDQSQVRELVKLRQVMARSSDRDSRFGDDSEQRNVAFFQRHLLINFEAEFREKTFLVDDPVFPFGFEYISRTRFQELNLGDRTPDGDPLNIAGHEFKTKGFAVCSHCGAVSRDRGVKESDKHKNHASSCPYWDKPDRAKILNLFYLYRQFESESIRFLMPDDTFWTTEGLHSFLAALQLGLKEKFGGQIGHLKTTICAEPQPDTTLRKSFLYLYDTVPGGTGYLRQLVEHPEEMQAVFTLALQIVRSCACQHEGDGYASAERDGCYECLFAYRHSFDHDKTSRKRAQALLSTLMHHWPKLKPQEQGLAQIKLDNDFDSELERKFIEAIEIHVKHLKQSHPAQTYELRKDVIRGKTGYYLQLDQVAWRIELHAKLDHTHNIDVPSLTDFIFYPANAHHKGRPVVVFTDGWQYHQDRLDLDFKQRLAILRSEQFWCWSITWDDVSALVETEYKCPQLQALDRGWDNDIFKNQSAQLYSQYRCETLTNFESKSSLQWLFHYLQYPDLTPWQGWSALRVLAQADQQTLQNPQAQHQWQQTIEAKLGELEFEAWHSPPQFMCQQLRFGDYLTLWTAVDFKRHQEKNVTGSLVLLEFDNTLPLTSQHQQDWRETLRLLNLYQFLPYLYCLTTQMRQQQECPQGVNLAALQVESAAAAAPAQSVWMTLKNEVDQELHPLIDHIMLLDVPPPEIDCEISNSGGQVIAQAELAWPDFKVAITDNREDAHCLSDQQWFVQSVEDAIANLPRLQQHLSSIPQNQATE
ncbi:MAG: DUF1998 domain-containing protein [Spirulina sp. DLM2.Bin59]|nr:MAG: DUF1998 domain-containing protein [Spirulina sp. DLM2.Bin59]